MKYNNDKSITITKYLIILVQLGIIGLSIIAYWFFNNYKLFARFKYLVNSLDKYLLLFIISTYLILLVGFYIMSNLSKLINNINEEEIFTLENINLLRYISWACFLIAFISLLSTFYYYVWFIIFVVGIFMGMLLRVIKNVFSKALEIKEENDLTV